MLHFNARSIKAKWNEVEAELEQEEFAVCCIGETWIADDSNDYNFRDYESFADNRHGMWAGGVPSFLKPELRPVLITNRQSTNNAYNIVAIKLLSAQPPVNIFTVYRAP